MPKFFISYSRADLNMVLELERTLLAQNMEVWRDQHSIRSGEQWPKAIGEALAACDAVLLAWSANSANTAAVEFEWNTALALGKKIIPWMLDETPLPASLKTFNWVKEHDTASVVARILQSLPDVAPTDATIKEQVIAKLASIRAVEERDVLAQAKSLFNQTSLQAGGHIIQSGGNVTITESRHQVPLIVAALAVVAVITLAALYFTSRTVPSPAQPSPLPTVEMTTFLRGQVDDNQGNPIEYATVKIEITGKLPKQTMTTSNGGFIEDNIPAREGDRVRVYVSKDGYREHNEYIALPGPLTVTLEKKQ